MKDIKPEDFKALAESFKESWQEIKKTMDSQQDEIRMVTEVLGELIEARKEQEEVIKKLIDNQF